MAFLQSKASLLRRVFSPIGSFKKGVESVTRLISSRYPYRVAQTLQQFGNKRIESITLYRVPITPIISKLLTILSFGRWDDAKKKIHYDDLFHLYMIIQFADDSKVLLEKNQNVHITEDIGSRGSGDIQTFKVDIKDKSLTLYQLLENAKKGMGANHFYEYRFDSWNCQDFIQNVLRYNGLLTPESTAFILQPVDQLVRTLPPNISRLATATTTTASYINRVLQSLGMKGFAQGGIVM